MLLYKQPQNNNNPDTTPEPQFLLGMVPQRNGWTVFKGLPDASDQGPVQTALREFQEETGCHRGKDFLHPFQPLATLHGRVGKKRLEIYLHEGADFDEDTSFCLERVVTIDSGYMQGKPEIVRVKWLTLHEALQGSEGAKIYKSQENILQEAHTILMRKFQEQHETQTAKDIETNDEIANDGESETN